MSSQKLCVSQSTSDYGCSLRSLVFVPFYWTLLNDIVSVPFCKQCPWSDLRDMKSGHSQNIIVSCKQTFYGWHSLGHRSLIPTHVPVDGWCVEIWLTCPTTTTRTKHITWLKAIHQSCHGIANCNSQHTKQKKGKMTTTCSITFEDLSSRRKFQCHHDLSPSTPLHLVEWRCQ